MTFQNVDGYREFTAIPGYRRAVVKTTKRTGKTVRRPDLPARFCGHTTEGLRFFDYPYPPQTTVAWGGGHSLLPGVWDLGDWYDLTSLDGPRYLTVVEGQVVKLQHCAIDRSGYALKAADPVETNHAGHCLQTEFVSRAQYGDDWYPWELAIVAGAIREQTQALRDALGDQSLIDLSRVDDFQGSAAYGFGDPYEMTKAQWYAFGGVTAHQRVYGQSHWDWGNVNHIRLRELLTAPSPIIEEELMNVTRIAGADRFATAAAVSQDRFPNGAPVVYITTGYDFPDALAAGTYGGPLLFVARDMVPAATVAEIKRLNPELIKIFGGTASVSAGVAAFLESLQAA